MLTLMAGELLFQVMNREAAAKFANSSSAEQHTFDRAQLFLGRGNWSSSPPTGPGFVLIDGSAFFLDAEWLYTEQDGFQAPLGEGECRPWLIPNEVVARWRSGLENLAADGEVARSAAQIRACLIELMDIVLSDDRWALTVSYPL